MADEIPPPARPATPAPPAAAGAGAASGPDPIAVFLAEPQSHLTDILYLYFRCYKRDLVWRFFERAAARLRPAPGGPWRLADIGAAYGYDFKYIIHRLTGGFARPWERGPVEVTLVEGDAALLAVGEREWAAVGPACGVRHRYMRATFVRPLPLADASQHILLCSEVVEHMAEPEKLLREMYRVLQPGGFLLFTTDNSPSALQWLRRVPVWLAGRYQKQYATPVKENDILKHFEFDGEQLPSYGHISLHPTAFWERAARTAGFQVAEFGTYESIRRGGGRRSPGVLALYFLGGFLVSLLPTRLGRFFGDTTALLLRKPTA